jgi:hypothetical protein
MLLATAILSGCDGDYEREMQKKMDNPQVTDEITVDGCDVKYYDRGYSDKSFHIAKCGNTTTISRRVQSGKTHRDAVEITTLDQQIADLTAQRDELQKQDKLKSQAISKLTPDERAALGIPASSPAP